MNGVGGADIFSAASVLVYFLGLWFIKSMFVFSGTSLHTGAKDD